MKQDYCLPIITDRNISFSTSSYTKILSAPLMSTFNSFLSRPVNIHIHICAIATILESVKHLNEQDSELFSHFSKHFRGNFCQILEKQ